MSDLSEMLKVGRARICIRKNIWVCILISILILVGIMGYVFFRGISQINWEFLSTVPSTIKGTFGILGNIVNTLYIVVITLLIATPLGVGAAIYLK